MMPLCFADLDADNTIKKIGGSPEVKKHLENLGFVVGGSVRVISRLGAADHHLLRIATAQGAGAPEGPEVRDGDAPASRTNPVCCYDRSRSRADDRKVISLRH